MWRSRSQDRNCLLILILNVKQAMSHFRLKRPLCCVAIFNSQSMVTLVNDVLIKIKVILPNTHHWFQEHTSCAIHHLIMSADEGTEITSIKQLIALALTFEYEALDLTELPHAWWRNLFIIAHGKKIIEWTFKNVDHQLSNKVLLKATKKKLTQLSRKISIATNKHLIDTSIINSRPF